MGALLSTIGTAQANEFVPGEILVGYRSEIGDPSLHSAISSKPVEHVAGPAIERIVLPKGMWVMDAVAFYQSQPQVAYAEPNYYRELHYSPNDSMFGQQGPLRQLQCDDAWDITKGKTSVVVAVIDTGIDKNHADLKNKIVPGWDFQGNDSDPTSSHVHGSHTAGLAAADTDNGIGIAGAGFRSRIMPLRVSVSVTASQSSKAIRFAADHGAKVISMSYGGTGSSSTERAATEYAWGKGVVLLASAGNSGSQITYYPAGYEDVISVGSVDSSDDQSNFSNYGPAVDVAAPGENVWSTVPGGYGRLTGTSMSCPEVAGIVALLWSVAGPETTNSQIRNVLQDTCDEIGPWLNHGRVNAREAVHALLPEAEFVSPPTTIQSLIALNPSGSLSDVLTVDASAFTAGSVSSAAGQVVELASNTNLVGPATNLAVAQLNIAANGPLGASLSVTAQKAGSSEFQRLGSIPLRPTGSTVSTITLPGNLTPILEGGALRLRLRATLPKRPFGRQIASYTLRLNFIEVRTRPSP